MKTIFVLIALLLLWESALSSVSWTTKTPTGAQPHQVSKPNVVAVTNRKIVMFNGVKDDCATATNTWYSNEQVYIYDTKTNEGSWLTTTGDIPPAASFATAWKSGHGKVTVGGGGNYPYYYAPFTTYGFDTLYELDIFSGVWTTIETSGDVPSPRLEVSHHEAGDKIYLYGGVAPSPSNPYDYLSYGEVYEYDQSCREFTRLKNSSPLDDGSDGIPTSRYHAHLFKSGNKLEIYQGVHRVNLSYSFDTLDTWRFNIRTRQWGEIHPSPLLSEPRRHGANFQFNHEGSQYGCIFSGDVHAIGITPTPGCLFATNTVSDTVCRDLSTTTSGWFTLTTTGTPVKSKYPGSDLVGGKLYVLGGHDVDNDPSSPTYGQFWLSGVRVLDLTDLMD